LTLTAVEQAAVWEPRPLARGRSPAATGHPSVPRRLRRQGRQAERVEHDGVLRGV